MKRKRIEPGPGQESVWDYPRPPRVELCSKHIEVIAADLSIADSRRAMRVLETSHPPVYYLPPEDVRTELLRPKQGQSWCEWKGSASYFDLVLGDDVRVNAAWYYAEPTSAFESIRNYIAFYPSRVDGCFVDGERVRPQLGDFYGGWITSNIVGPIKGGPGTMGW